ncbi:MAG TPA: hypothetical protein VGS98_09975 [Thermoanaerobaculia bacterium]|nr:hypothetical protein [Thermoanaerobaculia bacterium]
MGEGAPSPTSSLLRATAIGLVWLALFALVYTLGDEMGAWPKPPLGALRDLDLIVGLLAGVAVLVALLAPGRELTTEN